ncbi:MAG TPA: hypothetical protein VLT79_04530 [Gemmatimonadales bacterium]|nr:hypothetical protein [Gemmatimonadales bacterium]
MPTGTYRSVTGSILTLISLACTTVRPIDRDQLISAHPPARVRVTRSDATTLTLDAPRLVGDTLQGTANGAAHSLRFTDVVKLEAREPSDARTGALVASILVGGAIATVIVAKNQSAGPGENACPVNDCPFDAFACCGVP